MSTPFLGEIKLISWNFAPQGWAFCNGQLLPINQNQALFSILGTTYGGNGQTTFALPDLRGRVPVGADNVGQGAAGRLPNIAAAAKVLGGGGGEDFHLL
ncbi:MAG: phage tail protein, partial [Pyrinomonadaceae bacterium]